MPIAKGDFFVRNIAGQKKWFSRWLDAVKVEFDRTGTSTELVTHWMLIDGFKKGVFPEAFVASIRALTPKTENSNVEPRTSA